MLCPDRRPHSRNELLTFGSCTIRAVRPPFIGLFATLSILLSRCKLMISTMLFLTVLLLADVVWTWKNWRKFRPIGIAWWLLASVSGILVLLACSYISTLPSHAPLRTVTGLATYRSSGLFNRHYFDFILIEEKTGHRIVFHTGIDGPWNNQPIRATYIDDGGSQPTVVRIEILSERQVPWWHVEKGHAGWVGTAEAKREAPLWLSFTGFLLIVLAALTSPTRIPSSNGTEPEKPIAEGTSS
jgi:hypothetical protein